MLTRIHSKKKPRKICIIKFQCIPKPQKKMILNWICEYLFPNATCFEPWEKFYFLPSSFFPLWHHFHSRSSSVGMPHSRTQNVPNFSSPYKMESLQWPPFCHLSDGGSPTWTGVKPRSVWRKKSKEKYWKRDAFGAFFSVPPVPSVPEAFFSCPRSFLLKIQLSTPQRMCCRLTLGLRRTGDDREGGAGFGLLFIHVTIRWEYNNK